MSVYEAAREKIAKLYVRRDIAYEVRLDAELEYDKCRKEIIDLARLKNFPKPHRTWERSGSVYYRSRDNYFEMHVRYIHDLGQYQLVVARFDVSLDFPENVVWCGPLRNNYFEAVIDLYERVCQPAPGGTNNG